MRETGGAPAAARAPRASRGKCSRIVDAARVMGISEWFGSSSSGEGEGRVSFEAVVSGWSSLKSIFLLGLRFDLLPVKVRGAGNVSWLLAGQSCAGFAECE